MSELSRLQERILELESQLGIEHPVLHMYEGVCKFPTEVEKIIGHMPPVTRIEFGGKAIILWGGSMCLTLNLDAEPFTKPFTFEVAP
jgi:hypothetical protein